MNFIISDATKFRVQQRTQESNFALLWHFQVNKISLGEFGNMFVIENYRDFSKMTQDHREYQGAPAAPAPPRASPPPGRAGPAVCPPTPPTWSTTSSSGRTWRDSTRESGSQGGRRRLKLRTVKMMRLNLHQPRN